MKTNFIRALVGVAATTLFAAGANAAGFIGVDFNNNGATNQSPGVSDVVGPYASAGWYNQINVASVPGPTALVDSGNNATTATFGFTQGGSTLSGNPIYNSGYGAQGSANGTLSANQQLYNGSVSASPAGFSQELVLQNVPYALYDVYVLVNAPRVATDTPDVFGSLQHFDGGVVGGAGTTYFFKNSNESNALIPPSLGYVQATGTTLGTATAGANYVRFSNLTNPNQKFDFLNPSTPAAYVGDATLGGFAIVEVTAVPEPASLGLALLGGLLATRRRRA